MAFWRVQGDGTNEFVIGVVDQEIGVLGIIKVTRFNNCARDFPKKIGTPI